MPPRFYAPDANADASIVTLPAGESVHLRRVLRLREGDAVEVFDGRGTLRAGRVHQASAQAATVELDVALDAAPEAPARVTIVQALLKGDAMDAVVRDATVLGASVIQPVVTARTNVPRRGAESSFDRWHRVAVAAAKQCGRAVLPEIAPVRTLSQIAPAADDVRLWLTEPAVDRPSTGDVPLPPRDVCLAIGPEGGWAPEEVDAALAAGWEAWSLGPVTLRAEQVTLAALSVIRYAWADGRRRIT